MCDCGRQVLVGVVVGVLVVVGPACVVVCRGMCQSFLMVIVRVIGLSVCVVAVVGRRLVSTVASLVVNGRLVPYRCFRCVPNPSNPLGHRDRRRRVVCLVRRLSWTSRMVRRGMDSIGSCLRRYRSGRILRRSLVVSRLRDRLASHVLVRLRRVEEEVVVVVASKVLMTCCWR